MITRRVTDAVLAAIRARGIDLRGLDLSEAVDAIAVEANALLERAHAERPAAWVDYAAFLEHAFVKTDWATADDAARGLAQLHAGDLYVACACVRGVAEAIDVVEREHLSRVAEFAGRTDARPETVSELKQELRTRLFVGVDGAGPRILSYSGRGSLGAWIRVSTARLAIDRVREREARGRAERRDDGLDPGTLDPELRYIKEAYGGVVNEALAAALEALPAEARGLLKMHYVDGVSIDRVGVAFGVSRATAARRLADAREALLFAVRERIAASCGARSDEADSLLALVRSQLDLTLSRALASRSG